MKIEVNMNMWEFHPITIRKRVTFSCIFFFKGLKNKSKNCSSKDVGSLGDQKLGPVVLIQEETQYILEVF